MSGGMWPPSGDSSPALSRLPDPLALLGPLSQHLGPEPETELSCLEEALYSRCGGLIQWQTRCCLIISSYLEMQELGLASSLTRGLVLTNYPLPQQGRKILSYHPSRLPTWAL